MSLEEGLPFLTKISGFHRDLDAGEQRLALELLQLLEYFPLAIEQAGAYISLRISDDPKSYRRALEDYLDAYRRNAKMLLRYKRPSVIWSNRNDTILTTWEVSFNAIKKESLEASNLLLLCGFLADSDIFEGMFSLGLKTSTNDTTFRELVSKLSSYSLVRFRGAHDAFSIHPLVRVWARERLPLDVQQRLAKDVVRLLARGLDFKKEHEPRDYSRFEERIVPHLDNALEHMQTLLSSSTTQADILAPSNFVRHGPLSTFYEIAEGWYLRAYGIVNDISIFCCRYLLSDFEAISEWQLVYNLGIVYRNQGLYQCAERVYQWAFSEARTRLPLEHPKTLEIAGDLAWAMFLQERYDEALDWYNWLLASRKKVLGKGHPSTLGAMKGLAAILGERGDIDSALRLSFEVLEHQIAILFDYKGEHNEALK
ncbi:hypothetical protein GGR58DRAFT_308452 [Xylaria digitata]|nr:hypothetical protein GGR58DRAFT_308452 [Xylaria digitata]